MPLTVTHHFADFKPGDSITDPAVIEAILKSDNAVRVVKVAGPERRTGDRAGDKQ
jgi:hypothetical protein